MRQRVATFVVAFLVAAAPAALTACEIMCAAHSSRLSSDAVTHSCHATQRSDAPAVGSGAHVCGHESDIPAAAKPGLQTAYVPVIDIAPFSAAGRTETVGPRIDSLAVISPGSAGIPTPLRI